MYDDLALGGLHVEIPERTDRRHRVARPQAEDVGGADAGRAVLPGGRRGDADVEAQEALEPLVAGDRVVVAPAGLGIAGDEVEHVLGLPDRAKGAGMSKSRKRIASYGGMSNWR